MKRFEGKVVLVTGASRGIGQAIALAFASEGAHAIGVSRGNQSETAAKAQKLGANFTAIGADFAQLTQKGAAGLVARVASETGRLDALINNAGIIRRAPAVEYPEEDWNAVIQINLTAPFFLCQAAAKWWMSRGREQATPETRLRIVNIASILSFQGGILVSAYAASKSGIAGITRALANEWAKERINVNAIAPGYIATENTRALREDTRRNEAILSRIPEGRWGAPDDIAGGCMFLASDEANYLNGAILNIDGGWLSR